MTEDELTFKESRTGGTGGASAVLVAQCIWLIS